MLGIENFPLFLVAAVLLALTPGPDTLYVLTRSVVRGRREGVLSVAGISCGLVIHALLAAFGVSAFLATSAAAFSTVKYLGATYLLYLGARSLLLAGARANSRRRAVRDGHFGKDSSRTSLTPRSRCSSWRSCRSSSAPPPTSVSRRS